VPGAQAPPSADYSQQSFVVEHSLESMRFENDGTGSEEHEAVIKVTSEAGVQALGQLKIGYSALSDKLQIDYVRVRKPDGTVVTAQESAIQDLTIPDAPVYTDYHQKHISVPSLRPGDTLEFRYVRTIVNPLIPGQFWTSYSFTERGIVLDEQVEINVPKDRAIKLKTQPGYDPKISDEGDRRIYRWTHSQTKPPESPLKRRNAAEEPPPPSIQLTTFQSWEQLGDWYRSLEKDRRVPTAAIKTKADSLVEGKTTDMAKVKALYDYVSRDFRYVSLSLGLDRYQPHAAEEVMNVGYGDCKDKNTLLAALLQAEGFESTSVLINAVQKIDPDVPSPSQFDHVITRVPVDGQEIWLDSTSGVTPFRMLAFPLRDKLALAVPPEGKPGLVRTPAELPFPAYDRSWISGSLSDMGKLSIHVATSIRGDRELALRFALRQIPRNHWKEVFEASLKNSPMREAEIDNLHVSDPSDADNPLQIDYNLIAPNYIDGSAPEARLVLPISTLRMTTPDEDAKDNPIKLGPPQEVQAEASINIPIKYTVQLPIGVDVKRDYVEYHSSYKMENNKLVASRSLKLAISEIPVDRRSDYMAFLRVVESDQVQVIRLVNKMPGMSGISSGGTPKEWFESGVQALSGRNYDLALELFERVQSADPNHKDIWKYLGRVYLATDQDQKAVEAYQKQVAANPYDESAYSELGQAYENQQKYDEAIAQFKKQLEINPLDGGAHASLGVLYLTLKRFNDAVPELEKAVSVQPNNPLMLASLGQAYLGAGQTQKGMEAFDKAITMAPSPLVWNNVAYSLAEQNTDLKRADGYADTAINALDTQLRDVTLATLRFPDLDNTQMLFNVWDTKGWVLYKMGDMDKAEAYILPAWQGTENGSIAEHIGDIANKRGQRDQAVKWYVLSLLGNSPSATARDKLKELGVSGGSLNSMLAKAGKDRISERTEKLDAVQSGTADFFLLVSPSKVEDVKFIKGEDSFRTFSEMLKSVNVPMQFPPSSQVHVVRRVRVTCGKPSAPKTKNGDQVGKAANSSGSELPGPCTLEWIPTSEVRGLE
jgi:tetratricopeptide (TPR) repeat protein/transglutaminase-like putative cysteine protease